MGRCPQDPNSLLHMDQVVRQIFATMMGCECVAVADAPGGDAKEKIFACVEFVQGCRYDCRIELGCEDADALVRLLTGVVDERLRADVAGELCNMIAGRWIGRVEVADGPLELMPPRTGVVGDLFEEDAAECIVDGMYSFGSGCFRVRLNVREAWEGTKLGPAVDGELALQDS